MKYKCVIETGKDCREFMKNERSALKLAFEHGRREPGETISVYSPGGALLTRAKWSGRKFYACCT